MPADRQTEKKTAENDTFFIYFFKIKPLLRSCPFEAGWISRVKGCFMGKNTIDIITLLA